MHNYIVSSNYSYLIIIIIWLHENIGFQALLYIYLFLYLFPRLYEKPSDVKTRTPVCISLYFDNAHRSMNENNRHATFSQVVFIHHLFINKHLPLNSFTCSLCQYDGCVLQMHILLRKYIYTYILYIYIYIHIYVCVCVCVCVLQICMCEMWVWLLKY